MDVPPQELEQVQEVSDQHSSFTYISGTVAIECAVADDKRPVFDIDGTAVLKTGGCATGRPNLRTVHESSFVRNCFKTASK